MKTENLYLAYKLHCITVLIVHIIPGFHLHTIKQTHTERNKINTIERCIPRSSIIKLLDKLT